MDAHISLFDFDYLTARASKCETNHFHIIIEEKLRWPFFWNKKRVKGLFMHEYIHYYQHLSTLCGISLSMNYNKLFRAYRQYFEQHEKIKIPLRPTEVDQSVSKFFMYFNNIKGTREYGNRIDQVRLDQNAIASARNNRTAVPVLTYNQETNQWSANEPLLVGYYAIVESMADMIQRQYDPAVNHNDVPYQVVKRVCEAVYSEISTDPKRMISLCLLALMDSNPGVGLFDAIHYAKEHPEYNGYDLYKHYVEEKEIHLPSGEVLSIAELYNRRLEDYKKVLKVVFNNQTSYFEAAINNAIIVANSGNNQLLALLYDRRIGKNRYVRKLSDIYGYPFIESNNISLWPGGKRNIDVAAAIGFELLLKRFSSQQSTDCLMSQICRRNNKFEYDCLFNQWNHQGNCPFTAALHFFNLRGKIIEWEDS